MINIDTNAYAANTRDSDTVQAAGCLIDYNVPGGVPGDSDSIDPAVSRAPSLRISGGQPEPGRERRRTICSVSDSLGDDTCH